MLMASIPEDGWNTFLDRTSSLRVCNRQKCAGSPLLMPAPPLRMEHYDGTSSSRVYYRAKHKKVLTHLCWCPPHPWEWKTTLRYMCAIGLNTKCADSPLLMPASSPRMEHSLMGTSSLRVCNRVKHKNVLTHLCWCPLPPSGWNTPRWTLFATCVQ